MSNNVNIFENATPNSGEFFKFKNIGDGIQGTYIDKTEGTDSFGNEQIIYMIKDSDDKIWNIAFRKASAFVHERMASIKLGQIVGYRFDEEKESKKMPGTKAKIIRIYADNKFVDKEWLDRQKELELPGATTAYAEDNDIDPAIKDVFTAPADATAVTGTMPTEPKNDALDAIRTLARTKGLTHETMTQEDSDRAIEAFAELSLTEENMTKIIIKLTGFTK